MCRETMADILAAVSIEKQIPVHVLKGRYQTRKVAHARQEAMARIYATGRYTLHQVGRFFGRDHTTILHGVRAHQKRAEAE